MANGVAPTVVQKQIATPMPELHFGFMVTLWALHKVY
jgi:hypothetical protein